MDISSLPFSLPPAMLITILCSISFIFIVAKFFLSPDKPKPEAGSFLDFITNLLLSSPTNTIPLPPTTVITSNPSNIEHILNTNFANYPKGETFSSNLYDLLGGGIFNSDGDLWKIQRKIASIGFSTRSIRSFVADSVEFELLDRFLPFLARAANTGEVVDLQETLERFAFDNVCKVAFDVDPARLSDGGAVESCERFCHAFETAAEIIMQRGSKSSLRWRVRRALRIGEEGRLHKALVTINEFTSRVVKERKLKGSDSMGNDFLSRFIVEGKGEFSDEFLRDVIISFVLAGRDTTSTALTWVFYFLSSRPDIRRKILDEIKDVRSKSQVKDKSGTYTLDELREMQYLHAVISETLRLRPPVALEPRYCAGDDVWPDGTVVKKGMSVMYNSYAMGKMKSIWGEDCEEFRPERWIEKGTFQPKSAYKFPIFHAGPRTCLGKDMAYIQMKAVAAAVLERFELEVDGEKERPHGFTIVLRMKGGLPVRVKERSV